MTLAAVARSEEARRSNRDLGVRDQSLEERLVQPVGILERIEDGKPGLDSEKHGRVAVRQMQVDEQRASWGLLGQSRRRVDGDRGCADTTFGSHKHEDVTLLRGRGTLSDQSVDRRSELVLLEGGRDTLVDPGAKGFEHERWVERRRDDEDTELRQAASEVVQIVRQLPLCSEIETSTSSDSIPSASGLSSSTAVV